MLLSQTEILDRIQLYTELQEAIKAWAALGAALPVEVPPDITVEWTGQNSYLATSAVAAVCTGAWTSLRAAAMAGAKRKMDEAEQRVADFEAGKEV